MLFGESSFLVTEQTDNPPVILSNYNIGSQIIGVASSKPLQDFSNFLVTDNLSLTGVGGFAAMSEIDNEYFTATPESSTLLLLGLGSVGLALLSCRIRCSLRQTW